MNNYGNLWMIYVENCTNIYHAAVIYSLVCHVVKQITFYPFDIFQLNGRIVSGAVCLHFFCEISTLWYNIEGISIKSQLTTMQNYKSGIILII